MTNWPESNELTVRAQCPYSRSGEGLHRFTDPADKGVYLYSDLETFDAHRIYACFDQPDLKATFEFDVRCPDTWQVISNMAPSIAGQPADLGVERWHFPPTPLMSDLHHAHFSRALPRRAERARRHPARASSAGSPWRATSTPTRSSRSPGRASTTSTRRSASGTPFGKYDQLFVPEYKSGAMENAGAVTFLEDYIFRSRVTDARHEVRAETILHEMAHMWFGDLVTMRWWDDLWLNESFATWAGLEAPGGGNPLAQRMDHVHPGMEGMGLPAGSASVHPSDRGRHRRHRGGRGQLRRDHLRQGRVRAPAARRLCRPGELPGWRACLLRRARLG